MLSLALVVIKDEISVLGPGLGIDGQVLGPGLGLEGAVLAKDYTKDQGQGQHYRIDYTLDIVKRVFSQSRLLVHPHRAQMSNSLLETLIFLKCNGSLLV